MEKIMNRVRIPIVADDVPEYQSEYAAGCDLCTTEKVVIPPNGNYICSTGVRVEIPVGCEGQVRGRSGLNFNHGIIVPTGTIDADYRGEIKVKLYNLSDKEVTLEKGSRIAQLVISLVLRAEFEKVEELENTQRGAKGFGSSGIK